jgi:hypothetical protein
MQGRIRGIYLSNGSKMVNNHFVDDSLLLLLLDQKLNGGYQGFLGHFLPCFWGSD